MAKFPPLPDYLFLCPIEKLRARDLEIWRMAMEAAAEEAELQSMPVQARVACGRAIRALPEPSHE